MTNRLAKESSPYLQQHAENPVDWYPWGEEAFRRAKDENKAIHLSVGYAACHWCHVMAHESFENEKIAALMNEHFINIKVDRQERPDIDEVYQKVVQMQGQGGGWPLTVFMTPQCEPFFGGTYFPPQDQQGLPGFPRVLLILSDLWKNRQPEVQETASQFMQAYQRLEIQPETTEQSLEKDLPGQAARLFAQSTDSQYGGLNGAPKFPNVSAYDLILRVYQDTKDPALLAALEISLDAMASGGIFDQLGGGFARYTVDEAWAIPHFEKMLYDNGQLIKLYADAFRLTGKSSWLEIVKMSAAYIKRDMSHTEGGFYASEDADSEGEEGKFYVWTPAQVKEVLGAEEGEAACQALGIDQQGNFENNTSVPSAVSKLSESSRKELLKVRNQRPRPLRDENIISSWNALMIQGLCTAWQACGESDFLQTAKKAADFIDKHLSMPDGGVYRAWKDKEAKVSGFLDDYAFLANAMLDLYESCLEKSYLERARQLARLILEKFQDNGLCYTPKDGERLIHKPRASYDGALPSGISASLMAFLRLYELTSEAQYSQVAEENFARYELAASREPLAYAHLLAAKNLAQKGANTIILAGKREEVIKLAMDINKIPLPGKVLAFAEDVPAGEGRVALDGKPTIYLCRNRVCRQPVTTVAELLAQLK